MTLVKPLLVAVATLTFASAANAAWCDRGGRAIEINQMASFERQCREAGGTLRTMNGFVTCDCPRSPSTSGSALGEDWDGRLAARRLWNILSPFPSKPRESRVDAAASRAGVLNDEGVRAYAAGNYVTARDKFAAALRETPYDQMIQRNLGIATRAIAEEEQDRRDNAARSAFRAGTDFLRNEQYAAVERQMRRVLELRPNMFEDLAYQVLGLALARQGLEADAENAFVTALTLNPNLRMAREELDRLRTAAEQRRLTETASREARSTVSALIRDLGNGTAPVAGTLAGLEIAQSSRKVAPANTDPNQATATAKPNCIEIEQQLHRDQEALRRQNASIQAGQRELAEWTEANKAAQRQALKVGVQALFGGWAKQLQAREGAARSFQAWLTRYDQQLRNQGVPIEALQPKIAHALRGYHLATTDVLLGQSIDATLLANAAWELVRQRAGAVALNQAAGDTAIREALRDPRLRRFVETNPDVEAELHASMVVLAAESKELTKVLGPAAALASFVVDYGYSAKDWWESKERIVQQYNLTDDALRAVNALHTQLKRTVDELHRCRSS